MEGERESLGLGWPRTPVLAAVLVAAKPTANSGHDPESKLFQKLAGRSFCPIPRGAGTFPVRVQGTPSPERPGLLSTREGLLPEPPRGALPRKYSCMEGPERPAPTSGQGWGRGNKPTNRQAP